AKLASRHEDWKLSMANFEREIEDRIVDEIVKDWPDENASAVRRAVREQMIHQPYDGLLTIDDWKSDIQLNVIGAFRPYIMAGGARGPGGSASGRESDQGCH